jgi:hypothetical protein
MCALQYRDTPEVLRLAHLVQPSRWQRRWALGAARRLCSAMCSCVFMNGCTHTRIQIEACIYTTNDYWTYITESVAVTWRMDIHAYKRIDSDTLIQM